MKIAYEITIYELIVPYITAVIVLITAGLYYYMNKKIHNPRYVAMFNVLVSMLTYNIGYLLMVHYVLHGNMRIAGNMYAISQAGLTFLMPCANVYMLLLVKGMNEKADAIIGIVARVLFIISIISVPLSLASANFDFQILHWGTRVLPGDYATNLPRLAVPEIYFSLRNVLYLLVGAAHIGFNMYLLTKNRCAIEEKLLTLAFVIPLIGSMFDFFMNAGHSLLFPEHIHFGRVTVSVALFALVAFMSSISMFVKEYLSIDITRNKLAIINVQNIATIERIENSKMIFLEMQQKLSDFVRALNVHSKSIFLSSQISVLYTTSLSETNERFSKIDQLQEELYNESRRRVDGLYSSFEVLKKAVAGQAGTLDSIIDEILDSSDILINVEERIEHLNKMSNDLVDSYSKVRKSMLESFNHLDSIIEVASTVRKSIVFIKDISEKTNILSINANIQASKSSGWGNSFSFVAREISDLALDSKTAAERIDELFLLVTSTTNEFIYTKNYIIEVFDSIIENISGTMHKIQHISNIVSSQIYDNKNISLNTKFARELNTSIAVEIEARYDEIYEVIQRFEALDEQFEFFQSHLETQTIETTKLSEDMNNLIALSKELSDISEVITSDANVIEEEVKSLPIS